MGILSRADNFRLALQKDLNMEEAPATVWSADWSEPTEFLLFSPLNHFSAVEVMHIGELPVWKNSLMELF